MTHEDLPSDASVSVTDARGQPVVAVTDQGFSLHCETSGRGEAVLIGLHGGPGSGGGYLAPLHRLAGPRRTVVTFDQLGTERSETPPPDHGWTVAEAVADVDAVRRQVGAEKIDLLGHSWGGMLALQYTLDHPARVNRLVLSNTASSVGWVTSSLIRQLLDVLTPAQFAAAITADATNEHGDRAFRDAVARWLTAYDTAGDVQAAQDAANAALNPGPAGHGLWGTRLFLATAALRGWDVENRLSEISAPSLAIHGGRDMSGTDANRVLAEGIPDCEWITLQKNGHGPFDAANASTYLAIIESFLDGWPARTQATSQTPKDGAQTPELS